MTPVEQNLLSSLRELDAQVKLMRSAVNKPNLLPIFSRLEELQAQLPPDAHPSLRHYLQRRSYEKALLFLEEQAAIR